MKCLNAECRHCSNGACKLFTGKGALRCVKRITKTGKRDVPVA